MPRLGRIPAPTRWSSDEDKARALMQVMRGKLNVTGETTIFDATTETIVRDPDFGIDTVLVLVPTTAAGAALAWWQAGTGKGTVTVGHDAPDDPLTFRWIALG